MATTIVDQKLQLLLKGCLVDQYLLVGTCLLSKTRAPEKRQQNEEQTLWGAQEVLGPGPNEVRQLEAARLIFDHPEVRLEAT